MKHFFSLCLCLVCLNGQAQHPGGGLSFIAYLSQFKPCGDYLHYSPHIMR